MKRQRVEPATNVLARVSGYILICTSFVLTPPKVEFL